MSLFGSCDTGTSLNSGCSTAPGKIAPIAVPSLGATE
jgi:hypothetical protein